MSYEPFKNICEYYLDYLVEDATDNLSAFASGRTLSYIVLDEPEFSSRSEASLTIDELIKFKLLYEQQTKGNQSKAWWYGYPTLLKFISSQRGWQGGILKPLFVINVDVNGNKPILGTGFPRINNDAFRDLGLDLEQIRTLADKLGLFSDEMFNSNLIELVNQLKEFLPNIQLNDLPGGISFDKFSFSDQVLLFTKGIIFSTESSKYTQGLEAELNKIKDISVQQIRATALNSFFPELVNESNNAIPKINNISEAIELNEQQRETVQSALNNKLTVVTGPPGTGKSQVVASIVINAARYGQRVLFASKNHKAVEVVEERLNQFTERPFIIRLGRRGSDNRNIQLELVQYLNSLLGTSSNSRIKIRLLKVQTEIDKLLKHKIDLEHKIEIYRIFRNNLKNYFEQYETISQKIGCTKSTQIFLKLFTHNLSFLDKIKLTFGKKWKTIASYTELLKKVPNFKDLETLTSELIEIELSLKEKYKEEFTLWLNDLPSRLDSKKRTIIAQFVSVLEQLIDAGENNVPKKIWADLFGKRDRLMQELSGFLPAWCITSLSAKGQLPLIEGFFDLVIIDEASQCDIASALPLLFRAKRAVIIGDPNQLTHISTLRTARSLELMYNHNLNDPKYSVFEATKNSLYRLAASCVGDNQIIMLNEHFRSHKQIIEFSNKTWYSGRLEIGTDYSRLKPSPRADDKVIEWIDVVGNIQQVDGSGAYIINEINAVVEKVKELTLSSDGDFTLGVVTPFRLQANKIRQELIKILPDEIWSKTELIVDTAVKFQGDERDIMIFSPVLTHNMPKGIRYYHESEYNLLNVAITRARAKLIIIGNLNATLNCGITYIQNFAKYVIHNQEEEKQTTKAVGAEFESPYEKILYDALLKNGIKTIPQYQIDQYRFDLAYIDDNTKLDIEIDGVTYHTDWTGERLKQDIIRNKKLQKKGWTVLRFWSYEIRDNLNYCVTKVINNIRN